MNTLRTLPSLHARTVVTAIVTLLAVGRPAAADYDERTISNSRAFDLLVASDGQLYYIDHFGGELGTLDIDTGHKTPLLTGLRSPYHMTEFQNRIYFTEFGTSAARYADGALSVFDPQTGTHSRLREGLHAAASIEADSAGNLYVLEVPHTSTSFGGVNRLLKFPNAGGQYDVVIDQMSYVNPLALLLDEPNHRLFIGDGGAISPSNLGSLIAYSLDDGTSKTVLTGLPTVWDMEFDRRGNILVAGFGEDTIIPPPRVVADNYLAADVGDPGIPLRAVSYIPPTLDQFIPIRTGLDAWTVASDGAGSIYFATGRLEESIRVLSSVNLLLPGDLNEDGRVDAADISAMMAALADLTGYESAYGLNDADLLTIADLNVDGHVTNADVQGLLNLVASAAMITVPEPSSFALTATGLLALAFCVRQRSPESILRSASCYNRAVWPAVPRRPPDVRRHADLV